MQPRRRGGHDSPQQRIPEAGIFLARRPHGNGVQLKGHSVLNGCRAELPLVGRDQPGQAHEITRAQRLDDEPAAVGRMQVKSDPAAAQQPEPVGRAAFLEEPVPGPDRASQQARERTAR